eukprot:TRINITY_DN5525_c3_g3_i3.p2 TRINITY_DN5525_c3_g3~~TRINITY_DN5525_c3_g3_i3.p2  ORF type:complete len:261 (-),score=1.18 TRINITY_DN5525_c3_g3_i3:507-1289(-)
MKKKNIILCCAPNRGWRCARGMGGRRGRVVRLRRGPLCDSHTPSPRPTGTPPTLLPSRLAFGLMRQKSTHTQNTKKKQHLCFCSCSRERERGTFVVVVCTFISFCCCFFLLLFACCCCVLLFSLFSFSFFLSLFSFSLVGVSPLATQGSEPACRKTKRRQQRSVLRCAYEGDKWAGISLSSTPPLRRGAVVVCKGALCVCVCVCAPHNQHKQRHADRRKAVRVCFLAEAPPEERSRTEANNLFKKKHTKLINKNSVLQCK